MIHTCECGARVQLPDGAGGRVFRCPRCKAELLTTVDAKVLVAARPDGPVRGTCPICQTAIADAETVVTCPDCDQVHHRECWLEVGGCSTYGCAQAPNKAAGAGAAEPPTAAWGDTKKCPACGERIKAIALRCRYCGTDFDSVDPLTVRDLRRGAKKAEKLSTLQTTVIVLFILSLSGCLAPLALVLAPLLLWPKRALLAKAGPFYLVLGYSALALAVLYSVLMVLFLIFQ